MRRSTGSDWMVGSALPDAKKLSPRRRTTVRSASSSTVTRPSRISGSRKPLRRGTLAGTGAGAATTWMPGTRRLDTAA